MHCAVLTDEPPNLFLLHCELPKLTVENVFLIPHFAFSLSMLEKRQPLSRAARHAGWVGCNFLLENIPNDAQINILCDRKAVISSKVRSAYKKLRPLGKLSAEKRGWTLDVLNIARSLKQNRI
jgi:type II restriction enzyme